MESIDAIEAKIVAMDKKVIDAKKELCEVEALAFEVEQEFWE